MRPDRALDVRRAAGGTLVTAGLAALPFALGLWIGQPRQLLTDAWRTVPVERRGSTRLGISFRPQQVGALGLDAHSTLRELLAYPFHLVRLGAYWNRIESTPGLFDAGDLDWQVEAAERAGKQIVLCVGAVKTFGYPEVFVPAHHLPRPLPQRTLITPATHPSLLTAATEFLARVIERYRNHASIVAWQVENEAVDPLGFEHSWRLDAAFVEREVAAARAADPTRPIMMNGFFPSSSLVSLVHHWRTRDQGDSLDVARRLADVVGVDYYPCHALVPLGARTLYVDGTRDLWRSRARDRLFAWARASSARRLMVSEGQAEPWEAVTTPPNPRGASMYSCRPEHLIANYNRWMRWARGGGISLDAYLFWGAEYWMLRQRTGDPGYIRAFERVLELA